MTTPVVVSLPSLAAAVKARLETVAHSTVFVGEAVDVPLVPSGDGRVLPYLVLQVGAGDPFVEPDLGDCAVELAWTISVTCGAGREEDLLHLVDRVNTALLRWAPAATGYVCGPFRPPVGFQAPVLLDKSVTPHRPFLVLQFVSIITTA